MWFELIREEVLVSLHIHYHESISKPAQGWARFDYRILRNDHSNRRESCVPDTPRIGRRRNDFAEFSQAKGIAWSNRPFVVNDCRHVRHRCGVGVSDDCHDVVNRRRRNTPEDPITGNLRVYWPRFPTKYVISNERHLSIQCRYQTATHDGQRHILDSHCPPPLTPMKRKLLTRPGATIASTTDPPP